jgi:hypothetical protein
VTQKIRSRSFFKKGQNKKKTPSGGACMQQRLWS